MLTYLNHLKMNYLNEKGQGMVEYAVILAIVVTIGVALAGNAGTLTTMVTGIYTRIATTLATIH